MGIACITIDATMLTSLVGIHGIHHAEIRACNLVNNLLRMLMKYLGRWRRHQWFVEPLYMLSNILSLQKFVLCSYLGTPAFEIFVFHFPAPPKLTN
jgi:hypothetical protein